MMISFQTVKYCFAQWQYHSQSGLSEAWLLLVENYTQHGVQVHAIL